MTNITHKNTAYIAGVVLVLAFAFIVNLNVVRAQEEGDAPTPTLFEQHQENIDERRATAEERKAAAIEKMEARRADVEIRQVEMQANIETRQAEREVKQEERRQKLEEKRAERIAAYAERMVKRMNAAIDRFEKISDRVSSRIAKIEEKFGDRVDLSESKTLLEAAQLEINNARASVDAINAELALVLESDTPKEAFEQVRTLFSNAKGDLKSAHTSLVEAIKSVKVGVGEEETEVESEDDDTTTSE